MTRDEDKLGLFGPLKDQVELAEKLCANLDLAKKLWQELPTRAELEEIATLYQQVLDRLQASKTFWLGLPDDIQKATDAMQAAEPLFQRMLDSQFRADRDRPDRGRGDQQT